MDRSVWLPWAWGAGAVVCGVLLCLLQPWRRQFRAARRSCQDNRRLWMVPVLAVAAEPAWQWTAPRTPPPRLADAALAAGDSLAAVLTWIARGDVLAMVLAAAFLANSAGLRSGLWKGIDAAFSGAWRRGLQLLLLASATACLGIPAVRFGAGGASGQLMVRVLSSLWISTSATMLMCWLIRSFETRGQLRRGRGTKSGWIESIGEYTVRLWLPVLAGAVAFPLWDSAGDELKSALRACAWPAAALLAWFPLMALRAADAGQIHSVITAAVRRCVAGLLPFIGWLAVAGMHFFALHLLAGWLVSTCPAGSWVRLAAAFLTHSLWPWLAVWMLGAWVAIQVDRFPTGAKNAVSGRHPDTE